MTENFSPRSLCLVPMAGFSGFPDGPDDVHVGSVRFATVRKVQTDWIEFGFKENPIEKLFESTREHLEPSDVVVVMESPNAPQEALQTSLQLARQALEYLISSNPAWNISEQRRPVLAGISGGRLLGFRYAESLAGGSPLATYTAESPIQELKFDGFWHENAPAGFLRELNQLLDGSPLIEDDWRQRLIGASLLLGQARLASGRWPAFLSAMIGIERLLKRPARGWKQGVATPASALFSWLSNGQGAYYSKELYRLYELRNEVVHEGKVDLVVLRDAKLADEILFNLLVTAMKHTDSITSLDQFLDAAATMKKELEEGKAPSVLPNRTATYPWRY